MTDTIYDSLIQIFSTSYDLDIKLVKAICYVESRFRTYLNRYEPTWQYVINSNLFAHMCGTTVTTEVVNQSTSWGIMQVMGSVAREQGFEEPLVMLCLPEHGIEMGCKKLSRLMKIYTTNEDLAAAYNAGHATKLATGKYENQDYVDSVVNAYGLF